MKILQFTDLDGALVWIMAAWIVKFHGHERLMGDRRQGGTLIHLVDDNSQFVLEGPDQVLAALLDMPAMLPSPPLNPN